MSEQPQRNPTVPVTPAGASIDPAAHNGVTAGPVTGASQLAAIVVAQTAQIDALTSRLEHQTRREADLQRLLQEAHGHLVHHDHVMRDQTTQIEQLHRRLNEATAQVDHLLSEMTKRDARIINLTARLDRVRNSPPGRLYHLVRRLGLLVRGQISR